MKATEFRDLRLNNLVQFLSERSPTKERKALQKAYAKSKSAKGSATHRHTAWPNFAYHLQFGKHLGPYASAFAPESQCIANVQALLVNVILCGHSAVKVASWRAARGLANTISKKYNCVGASTVAAYIAQSMLNRKGYECEYISVVHAAMCCYPLSERDTTEKMHAIYTTFAVILTEYLTVAPKR